jgi:hypothetical protein
MVECGSLHLIARAEEREEEEMNAERVSPSGAIVVSALVNWEGVKWLESSTYYGYSISEAKASFKRSCQELNYLIEGEGK